MRVAAVSYDNVERLAHFAGRVGIGFPLLADPESELIGRFGLIDPGVPKDHPVYGFASAGYYLIDAQGRVTGAYFNDGGNDRTTASNILVREFDSDTDRPSGTAETRSLELLWSASNRELRLGRRMALSVDAALKPRMHVYAPGEHRYIAVDWSIEPHEAITVFDVHYPQAETKHLPAIKETVPVYHGDLRLTREIRFDGFDEGQTPPETIELRGTLRYQACDDKKCYLPTNVPLSWKFELGAHDRQRVPEEIRRK